MREPNRRARLYDRLAMQPARHGSARLGSTRHGTAVAEKQALERIRTFAVLLALDKVAHIPRVIGPDERPPPVLSEPKLSDTVTRSKRAHSAAALHFCFRAVKAS